MGKFYDNSLTLSKNKRKEKDNHPDYAGSGTAFGVKVWVNGWLKQGDDGPWISISIKPKTEGDWPKAKAEAAQDDIPF